MSTNDTITEVLDGDITSAEYQITNHEYTFRMKDGTVLTVLGEDISRSGDSVKKAIEEKVGISLFTLRNVGSWTVGKDSILPRIDNGWIT